jgi:outer membrane receptor protein involved in Fe transport
MASPALAQEPEPALPPSAETPEPVAPPSPEAPQPAPPPSPEAPRPAPPPSAEAPQPGPIPEPPQPEEAAELNRLKALSIEELLEVRIDSATRTSTELRNIPNQIVIITADDIRRRNYKYLIDIFDDLPEVQVIPKVQAESRTHVLVRGIWQNNKILILYNGQKINLPANNPVSLGQWLNLDNVERIEFIYGPASALYGADVVNGILSITTKGAPQLQNQQVELSAGYGLFNEVVAHANGGYRYGSLELTASVAYRQDDGPNLKKDYPDYYAPIDSPEYAAAGGRPLFESPSKSYDIQFGARLGRDTRLQYMRNYSRASTSLGLSPAVFENSKEAFWGWSQDSIGLAHDFALSSRVVLRTRIDYGHYRVDPGSNFINTFFLDYKQFVRDDYKFARGVRYSLTEDVVYTSPAERLQVVAGVRGEDNYTLVKVSTVTGLPATEVFPISYQTHTAIPIPEVNYQSYGGFAQLQYRVVRGVVATAGAGVDKVWYFSPSFNPRLGLTWSPTDSINLRASYARAFLTPAPYYLFENCNNAAFPGPGTTACLPNGTLKSENYQTADLGGSVGISQHLALEADLFYTQNNNYLLYERLAPVPFTYTPPIGNVPPRTITTASGILTNENAGRVRAFGGNLGVKLRLFGRLRGWAYYSYLGGKQDEQPTRTTGMPFSINHLGNESPHTIKGGLEVRVSTFYLTPMVVWYSYYNLRPGNTLFPNDRMPGHTLLNVSLSYERSRYRLWALFRNALNQKYVTPAGIGSSLDSPEQPQARFSFLAGADVGF